MRGNSEIMNRLQLFKTNIQIIGIPFLCLSMQWASWYLSLTFHPFCCQQVLGDIRPVILRHNFNRQQYFVTSHDYSTSRDLSMLLQ